MICQKNDLGPLADKIVSVRPGITGLWQTCGRSRTTFQKRIALDAEYVDRYTFKYDLLLIMKTIPQILFPKNAC
jgi:exopolysaccharide production protein ExoY